MQKVYYFLAALLCFLISYIGCTKQKQEATELTISAAISLKDALEEIKGSYIKQNPAITITYNFGSSGALQHQIEAGAPVDIFFSAAMQHLDDLERRNFVLQNTRTTLLTNKLVLIAPLNGNGEITLNDLTTEKITTVAMGEPNSVPLGNYTRQTLVSLGIAEAIQSKAVFAKSARQVLSYVETGNVDAGFVYATDAKLSAKIRILAVLADSLHSPILYPAAILRRTEYPAEAKNYLAYLATDSSRAVFEKYGFLPYTQ
ncbi:MAG: molybdate ABC transporter substrate-binding protein [Bacteroidetes bacterium]|nr:MAG: molybdate ABC transporter substrate-binding protein [Bacteroidota bacterium]